MQLRRQSALETRLAETLMFALFPCDLGDGIEVVHDVEQIEIELDCDLEEDAWYSSPYELIEIQFSAVEDVHDTLPFSLFEPPDPEGTVPYPRM